MTPAFQVVAADLAELRKKRFVALSVWVGASVVVILLLAGRSEVHQPLAVSLYLGGTTLAAAAALGVVLFRARALKLVALLSALAIFGAIGLVCDVDAALSASSRGIPCFFSATGFGSIAMIALGASSGMFWRRFPEPSLLLAIAVTGIALAVLHFRCGVRDPLHLAFHLSPSIILYIVARGLLRLKRQLTS